MALFNSLANICTKFLMMENTNLRVQFPHYLKAKYFFTLPELLKGLAVAPWL
jgi:hypothetical protein